eukprot:gene11141-18759_t
MATDTIFDIKELVQDLVTKRDGIPMMTKTASEIEGKYVGLYFSAHWCPPCKSFTPKLAQVYDDVLKKDLPFEIIFVSSDKSKSEFDRYYAEMPWTAVPFTSSAVRSKLGKTFGLQGIPTLVIVSPEGKVVSGNARIAVAKKGASGFPWEGAPLGRSPSQFRTIMRFVFTVLGCYLSMQFVKMSLAAWRKSMEAV